MDDNTFPALLKTLSDPSEEVIKHDLQLIAQISTSSEENYFRVFMHNLLELFSTDRRLLETRGSLIIRQLCLNLNTEKIYRTFAELLEREEVSFIPGDLRGTIMICSQGPRVCWCDCTKAQSDTDDLARAGRVQEATKELGNTGMRT